jgi:immediate early response 3-interacting protein 1
MALLFGFGTLIYVCLLLVNAIAILHEERFLGRSNLILTEVGLTSNTFIDPNSIQAKLANVISSVRTLLRIPLIVLNVMVIVYELLLG